MPNVVVPIEHELSLNTYGTVLEAMARLNKVFDRTLRDRCGISSSWFEALLRLERSGGQMTMGELADQVVLTSGGVTRLIDRMSEAGLVCREACPDDRRVNYAVITDRGRDVLREAIVVHVVDLEEHFMGLMSDDERQVVVGVMNRIRSEECSGASSSDHS